VERQKHDAERPEAEAGAVDSQRYALFRAVHAVAARFNHLLGREAFEQMADALRPYVDFDRLSVFVLDGPMHRRLYVASRGPTVPVPFAGRVDVAQHPGAARVVDAREPYVCDDARGDNPIDRAAAQAGYLSYVSIPIKVGPEQRKAAVLVAAFHEPGRASRAPVPLLADLAELLAPHLSAALDLARERRLAMILETSGDAMIAWDKDGLVTDANAAAEALTARSRDELIGARARELLVPLPLGGATPAQGERVKLHVRGPGGRGSREIDVSVTVTAVDDDPLVASHAILRDEAATVAAEREAAAHLARARELEEQHRTLLDNVPLLIFRLEPASGRLVYLNRHAELLLGVPRATALATPGVLRDAHATPEGIAAFEAAVETARSGLPSAPYEASLRRPGGDEIIARGHVYPLVSERCQVAAIEGVLADVSAERAARTRLVQTDRLSTLGTLAAGVAHEINNPAAFILLGLDMLARLLRGPGFAQEGAAAKNATSLVSELRDSIRRIVDITRDLRLFASPPAPEGSAQAIVDVNRTVESALTLTRGQLIERAEIVRELGDVPPVRMDGGRLGQVVVNLLVNAAQAIPKERDGSHAVTVVTRSDDRMVEIAVRDTGVGIPEGHLSRIWTPFFTTKTPDVGTGLGLSISREIVERAGGVLRVESPAPGEDPPRGTEFVVSLPVASAPEPVPPASTPPLADLERRLTVLLVEDEVALSRALAEELSSVHAVDVVGGARDALERLAARRYDVVLCDVKMPGMTGDQLFEEVCLRDPDQARAFVFMTGVGFGANVERFVRLSGRPLLEKPFTPAEALAVMRKVAAKNRPRRA
jgi:signal transduction histidine kinase/ActR/RegA family two-component response regulator